MPEYDVIVVGGGPAGLFAALELASAKLKVLLLEKGRDIESRHCPSQERGIACPPCSPCHMVSGLGGAGAFSDGKFTLSTQVGGRLADYLGQEKAEELIHHVDEHFLRLGADDRIYGTGPGVEELVRRASKAELKLVPVPLRHLGTEHCRQMLQRLRDFLRPQIDLRLGTAVSHILTADGRAIGVEMVGKERIEGKYVILAPGREGADWLVKEASRLKLTLHNNPIDVGVRVEVPAAVLEELTSVLYEPKLEYFSKSFDDRIRTFCVCPFGEVTMELTGGCDPVTTVNGHSYAHRKTPNTNFALLLSTNFTQPFTDPIAYGKYVARLANILSGGVLVQRLGDFLDGRRSTPARLARGIVEPTLKGATPGDLSCVLPYRFLRGIVEMLEAMDKLSPGVASRHTLLYGVEVKFYSSRPELSPNLETELSHLFACGDGAGISRGLAQASASGVVAAREIIRQLEGQKPQPERAGRLKRPNKRLAPRSKIKKGRVGNLHSPASGFGEGIHAYCQS